MTNLSKFVLCWNISFFLPCQLFAGTEGMIPYFSRHGTKRYIRSKPIKFRYKMWILATRIG